MFINKINSVVANVGFKSVNHKINSVGERVLEFNYPYDYNNEKCDIIIYRAKKLDNFNYQIYKNSGVTFHLNPKGKEINIPAETDIGSDEAFFYQVVRKDLNDKEIWRGADSGVKNYEINGGELGNRIHMDKAWVEVESNPKDSNGNLINLYDENGKLIQKIKFGYQSAKLNGPEYDKWQYTLVSQNGTAPLRQGLGYLAIPDSLRPGMRYKKFSEEGTGKIVEDKEYQQRMEKMVKTTSNMYGGSMAGLEAMIPELKKLKVTKFFTTPIASADNRTSHGYYNKHNLHIPKNMGNSENYDSLMVAEFVNGMNHVFDTTLTSYGIEGAPVRYASKWGKDAQTYDWLKASGFKDGTLSFGIIPHDAKNLSHRVLNLPFRVEKQSDGTFKIIEHNEHYNPNARIIGQIYDKTQVTDEQLKLDKEIDMYKELNASKDLKITSSKDTVISYVFDINPNEYRKNIEKINELIKAGKQIDLHDPEGTLIAMTMSNFSLSKDGSGYVAWDANPDMFKINYGVSPYDEKELQGITDRAERQYWLDRRKRGSKEALDIAVQTVKYWADKTKTAHTIYTVQALQNIKSADKLNKLIENGILPTLPQGNEITQDIMENILNGDYNLEPKGMLSKDDVTVKSLMSLPIDALEVGEDTIAVLMTSYFSNRATTDDTVGVSRFDLMKQDNPHIVEPYSVVYNKMNNVFKTQLKDFADSVIKKVNEKSNEKLIDSIGNYTEYGEYVMEYLGKNITKYALLKSLAGENFKSKMLPNGILTYDYENIENSTTLKALGINASNPTEEAELLLKKIINGLKTLTEQDVETVANSISQAIKGSDTMTFRIAEAFIKRASLELDYRLDAAKDVMDWDAVRNREADFDDTWENLIAFWKTVVKAIKEVNPHAYIVAEMTDIPDVMRDTNGGKDSCPYNGLTNVNGVKFNGEPDAMTKFYIETGITSEAAYSYFFTELLTSFSKDFESGTNQSLTHDDFKQKYDILINTRSADFLRNLYTFVGNHDKVRSIHGLSLDMTLFYSTLLNNPENFADKREQRNDVIRVLSGAKNMKDVPLELRLNVDNMEYFRTVSSAAVAQTKLLMDSINEDLEGIASKEDRKLLTEALIDLANGNYMESKDTEKMERIHIPEVSSIGNAIKENSRLAGGLTIAEQIKIQNIAENLNYENYLVQGDFDWVDNNIGENNKKLLREILGTDENAMQYSLYTLQIARMIKEAAINSPNKDIINEALKEYVKIYNRAKLNENMDGYKMYEDSELTKKKNSYAEHDFRVALEEAFKQAEFKSGRKIENQNEIIATVFNSITEPAIKKHAMMLSFLSAFCGIPTIFAGDEYGDAGLEYKSKNSTVKNRSASRSSEIESDTLMGKIMKRNKDVTYDALQAKARVKALQDGTSYSMDVMFDGKNREELLARISEIDEICRHLPQDSQLVKDLRAEQNMLKLNRAKVAFMMQSSDGDMAISVLNAEGIYHGNRVNYFEKFGLDTLEKQEQFFKDNNIERFDNLGLNKTRKYNPYIPMQEKSEFDAILMGAGVTIPIGTVFMNANGVDKTRYIVQKIKDVIGIVREDGKKIVMDGITSKHGAMVLNKVAFKGCSKRNNLLNKQYNFVSNPYKKSENVVEGEKLSIICK